MVFSSWEFVLGFLPVALLGYFLLGRLRHDFAIIWLVLASFAFYAWWSVPYIGLLLGSITINFAFAWLMLHRRSTERRQPILWLAVTSNLLLLGYFKYANFIAANLAVSFGYSYAPVVTVELPPGISFFTFTQIAFLVDTYRRTAPAYSIKDYALFVTYFPHLIAGPILHHKEMTSQFGDPSISRFEPANMGVGLSIFAIGMFKKLVIADNLAPFVSPVFDDPNRILTFWSSWGAALAYTFQLYFDFSGYCDIAIGISIMMNIRIPINFHSPYRTTSIIEFWRRWHITLGRFLRDYVYVPLGGNRVGPARKYLNLLLTMLIGGIWHGANWTFVAWGALHGMALLVNHAWRAVSPRIALRFIGSGALAKAAAWLLTFVVVVVAWVLFRAHDLRTALDILSAMFQPSPAGLRDLFAGTILTNETWTTVYRLGLPISGLVGASEVAILGQPLALALSLGLCFAIVLLMPNTQQFMERTRAFILPIGYAFDLRSRLKFRSNAVWATLLALLLCVSALHMTRFSPFLYFQF